MAEAAETEKHVLEAGNELTWTSPWGSGRGLYLGNNTIFSYETGAAIDVSSAMKMHVEDTRNAVMPVVVLNRSSVGMGKIMLGVFLGNLLTGIVVGIVIALLRA